MDYQIEKKYQETGSIARRPGSGRPSKIVTELGHWLSRKCVRTTKQLPFNYMYMYMPCWKNTTIVSCWTSLGWTFRGSKYWQLICELKRFEWAWLYITPSSRQKFQWRHMDWQVLHETGKPLIVHWHLLFSGYNSRSTKFVDLFHGTRHLPQIQQFDITHYGKMRTLNQRAGVTSCVILATIPA